LGPLRTQYDLEKYPGGRRLSIPRNDLRRIEILLKVVCQYPGVSGVLPIIADPARWGQKRFCHLPVNKEA